MRELRRVEKTRSDGVKQDYHVRATGLRSDRPTRDALRASRASESAVPREYAVRLRAASRTSLRPTWSACTATFPSSTQRPRCDVG